MHLFSTIISKIDVMLSNEAILFLRILSATCTNRNRLLDSKKFVDEYLLCFSWSTFDIETMRHDAQGVIIIR